MTQSVLASPFTAETAAAQRYSAPVTAGRAATRSASCYSPDTASGAIVGLSSGGRAIVEFLSARQRDIVLPIKNSGEAHENAKSVSLINVKTVKTMN